MEEQICHNWLVYFLLAGLEDKNVQKKTAPGVTLEPYAFR